MLSRQQLRLWIPRRICYLGRSSWEAYLSGAHHRSMLSKQERLGIPRDMLYCGWPTTLLGFYIYLGSSDTIRLKFYLGACFPALASAFVFNVLVTYCLVPCMNLSRARCMVAYRCPGLLDGLWRIDSSRILYYMCKVLFLLHNFGCARTCWKRRIQEAHCVPHATRMVPQSTRVGIVDG